jgi:hypothetical protein
MSRTSDVMPRLLSVFPEFGSSWEDYKKSNLYGQGEPYNDVGRLAQDLMTRMNAGSTVGFDQLFSVVEELLKDEATDVRELVTVGFLEDLQNGSLNSSIPLTTWEGWLGPRTREAWKTVGSLWSGELTPEEFKRSVE